MAAARRYLIAGNWKMNMLRGDGAALAGAIATGAAVDRADIAVCPPFPLLDTVGAALKGSPVALGAQDCSAHDAGAYTGEVSASMLTDAGCSHVIVGHSERRDYHGEEDAAVQAKAAAAQAAGMVPIVCVGETEEQRDAGATMDVISAQIDGSVPAGATAATLVIAYEPVWAIGTGRTATPDQAQEVHAHIRARLADRLGDTAAQGIRILYGGSMKPGNAAELLSQPDVDGGLIGGASLKADDFLAIAAAAEAQG